MKILLIAGHGAGDSGAVGCGLKEAELTREAVQMLKTRLSLYAEVTVYDINRNAYQDFKTGIVIPFHLFDYVLEVHFNSHKDISAHGCEIYVTTKETGIGVEKQILQRVCALGFINRGVKRKDFDVIAEAKRQGVSSALLEICFISNQSDIDRYVDDKREAADAITAGIVEGFGLGLKDEPLINAAYVQNKAGLEQKTMDYLMQYEYGTDLIRKLANAIREGE